MTLDRGRQHEMLLAMRAQYPGYVRETPDTQDAIADLVYLSEHGLCELDRRVVSTSGRPFEWERARITARGIDFLADDGGLSAILGIITIKLHADTIRELIAARIEAEPISIEEKSKVRRHLGRLSGKALEALTTELVKGGLHRIPDILTWLHTHAGL